MTTTKKENEKKKGKRRRNLKSCHCGHELKGRGNLTPAATVHEQLDQF